MGVVTKTCLMEPPTYAESHEIDLDHDVLKTDVKRSIGTTKKTKKNQRHLSFSDKSRLWEIFDQDVRTAAEAPVPPEPAAAPSGCIITVAHRATTSSSSWKTVSPPASTPNAASSIGTYWTTPPNGGITVPMTGRRTPPDAESPSILSWWRRPLDARF